MRLDKMKKIKFHASVFLESDKSVNLLMSHHISLQITQEMSKG